MFQFNRGMLASAGVLLALCAALVPLTGCGGGDNNNNTSALAPYSAYINTPYTSRVTLNNGNTATLNLSVGLGSTASGTLTVEDLTRAKKTSRVVIATPFVSGTFDPQTGAINVTGSYEAGGQRFPVAIVGTLPVPPATTGGSVTFTISGVSYTSTFSDVPATPTTPGGTNPPPASGNVSGALTFRNFAGAGIDGSPLNPSNGGGEKRVSGTDETVTLAVGAQTANSVRNVSIIINDPAGIQVGKRYPALGNSGAVQNGARVAYTKTIVSPQSAKTFDVEGDGQVRVDAYDGTNITVTLLNIGQFRTENGVKQVFSLDGTATVNSLTTATAPPPTGGLIPQTTVSSSARLLITNPSPSFAGQTANITLGNNFGGNSTAVFEKRNNPFNGQKEFLITITDTAGGVRRNVRLIIVGDALPATDTTLNLNEFGKVRLDYTEGNFAPEDTGAFPLFSAFRGSVRVQPNGKEYRVDVTDALMDSESPQATGFFDFNGVINFSAP